MAVLQYVGARYVPKLFDDGKGGMEWQANTYYEPLTIVTYNNASYISRKPVPAGIGNPVVNGGYWAMSGSFNAQISGLQEDVRRLKAPTRLIISDSYGNTSSPTWLDRIATVLEGNTITIAVPSAGFSADCPVNFTDVIRNYNGNKEDIDELIICAGANDAYYSGSQSAIVSGISTFIGVFKSLYPNAKFKLGEIGWSWGKDRNGQYGKMRFINTIQAYKAVNDIGGEYLNGVEYSLHRSDVFIGDGFHPNEKGQDYLLRWITEALKSGSANVIYNESATPTGSLQGLVNMTLCDGVVTYSVRATNIANNPVISLRENFEDNNVSKKLKFADLSLSLSDQALFNFFGGYSSAQCGIVTAGSSERITQFSQFLIEFVGTEAYISMLDKYGLTVNVNGITSPNWTFSMPALLC